MEKKETEKQAVPVMKQLARPMSQQELEIVSGANWGGGGCAPSNDTGSRGWDNVDYEN